MRRPLMAHVLHFVADEEPVLPKPRLNSPCKLNVLANAFDEFPSFFQSGLAIWDKTFAERKDVVRSLLRAQAKANRFFFDSERGRLK